MGKVRRGGEEKIPQPLPCLCTNPLPVKHPVTIQGGGIEPIYLAFGSEITPALQATFTSLEKRLLLNCSRMRENYWSLYYETNKEAPTMPCSVVKHLGSGRALKKTIRTLDYALCFPLHFFRALPLPTCFTTEQSTVKASLFVK